MNLPGSDQSKGRIDYLFSVLKGVIALIFYLLTKSRLSINECIVFVIEELVLLKLLVLHMD